MKTKSIATGFLFFLGLLLWSAVPCFGQEAMTNGTPKELLERMIHNPAFEKNAKGEDFCWNAAFGMNEFIDQFRLSRNTEWLDAAVQYYDFLVAKMDTDPDGYKGWIGPYEYDDKFWQDALVGDAILLGGILDFSVLVLENDSLKKTYADKANAYVQVAKKDFVEKWDKRGVWYEDGPYGSYTGFNKFLKPGDLSTWISDPRVSRAGISHPFNKQMDAAVVYLRLYRLTGDKFYRDRAERIFFTAKSHFQYFDQHYCWNYFEPLTPDDIDLKKKDTRHWVGVHPWRSGYQAGEVEKIAEAYHYGIVFDRQDMERIINTNLNVMWNKDKTHPKFINSNGLGADNDTTGTADWTAAYGHPGSFKNAGELWTGLLDFSQTIRDLYELRLNPAERQRYENSVATDPPGFKRKYSQADVQVPTVDFTESKELCMATVLPHSIANGKKAIIVCKSWIPGQLQIDLYSKSNQQIASLYKRKIAEGLFMITWDGKTAGKKTIGKGDYKIRWTIGEGYREFPVTVN